MRTLALLFIGIFIAAGLLANNTPTPCPTCPAPAPTVIVETATPQHIP